MHRPQCRHLLGSRNFVVHPPVPTVGIDHDLQDVDRNPLSPALLVENPVQDGTFDVSGTFAHGFKCCHRSDGEATLKWLLEMAEHGESVSA